MSLRPSNGRKVWSPPVPFGVGEKAKKSFVEENARLKKEKELNDPTRPEGLVPISFADFQQAYLATAYPGHELPTAQRNVASRSWTKSEQFLPGRAACNGQLPPAFCRRTLTKRGVVPGRPLHCRPRRLREQADHGGGSRGTVWMPTCVNLRTVSGT